MMFFLLIESKIYHLNLHKMRYSLQQLTSLTNFTILQNIEI